MLVRHLTLCLLATSAIIVSNSSHAQDRDSDARTVVRKSLEFLKLDQQAWRNKRHCASCHHGAMYVWAGSVAGKQGYQVDSTDIEETAHWLVTSEQARIFNRAPDSGDNQLSQATIFLAHALNSLPVDNPSRLTGWKRIAEHWLATQQQDGSWIGSVGRPPIFNTPATVTRLLDLAIVEDLGKRRLNRQVKNTAQSNLGLAHDRALSWLDRNEADDSHQTMILQLWALSLDHRNTDREKLGAMVRQLRDAQRRDGGWRQVADFESDAFATGQTLVAMHKAGVRASDSAIQRAILFLVKSQREDGTWRMKSRPSPANGIPASNLNPITYAATAWASMGLAMYVPESAEQRK